MTFFVNIVPNLGINTEHDLLSTTKISHNPIELLFISTKIILVSFQLKLYEGTNPSFSFHTVTKENTEKLMTKLNIK